jgi:hypothetical protein
MAGLVNDNSIDFMNVHTNFDLPEADTRENTQIRKTALTNGTFCFIILNSQNARNGTVSTAEATERACGLEIACGNRV